MQHMLRQEQLCIPSGDQVVAGLEAQVPGKVQSERVTKNGKPNILLPKLALLASYGARPLLSLVLINFQLAPLSAKYEDLLRMLTTMAELKSYVHLKTTQ